MPKFLLSPLLVAAILYGILIRCRGSLSSREKVYVVYMGDRPKGDISVSSLHTSILEAAGSASDNLLHHYHKSFNGFAAKLRTEEVDKIKAMDGVVSVFPSKFKQLHTTSSWDFVGFPEKVLTPTFESEIVIGVLDSGLWPEADSFGDKGFGPPPTKWKGSCQNGFNFTCNNKIIGGRHYHIGNTVEPDEFDSPRDSRGHGTHTASTAAGNYVSGASFFGLGFGTARGGVPNARLAIYKICWNYGCTDADILAAFDDAIADGVDIISLSVGDSNPSEYVFDSIAIGAFHSMKNGILTSNSVGNMGPGYGTITNISPWSLSVAASTIDRKFVTPVQLGNKAVYLGSSINTFKLPKVMHPIIYAGDAPNTTSNYTGLESRYCGWGSLDAQLVRNAIVLCDQVNQGQEVVRAGGAGVVMRDSVEDDVAYIFNMPACNLGLANGSKIVEYINRTSKPTAMILKSIVIRDELAPVVASFSSRGPSLITNDILKPDLTAPGVNILAAWPPVSPVSDAKNEIRRAKYNILSGTSMACPHATAAAAYVKAFHTTWSPAAIKSALMTTASRLSTASNGDEEFAYGSGHINPIKAVNPGLLYDAGEIDYARFLCGQGYNNVTLQLVTGDNSSSCVASTNITVWELNYPSFAISTIPGKSVTRVFHRIVTNVGLPTSTYKAVVKTPMVLKVTVEPRVLRFKTIGQNRSFVVTVTVINDKPSFLSGSLVWDDGVHKVRSPIVANVSPIS